MEEPDRKQKPSGKHLVLLCCKPYKQHKFSRYLLPSLQISGKNKIKMFGTPPLCVLILLTLYFRYCVKSYWIGLIAECYFFFSKDLLLQFIYQLWSFQDFISWDFMRIPSCHSLLKIFFDCVEVESPLFYKHALTHTYRNINMHKRKVNDNIIPPFWKYLCCWDN